MAEVGLAWGQNDQGSGLVALPCVGSALCHMVMPSSGWLFSRLQDGYGGVNGRSQTRYLCPQMDLIWKRDLSDVTKLRILRRDHPGLAGGTLNPMTSVLISRRRENGRGGEGHVKAEAEWSHEASGQAVSGATGSRKKQGNVLPEGLQRQQSPASTSSLDCWPPNCYRINTCSLKRPVCSNLLQKSREANAMPIRKLGVSLLLSRLALWANPEPVLGKAVGTILHGFHSSPSGTGDSHWLPVRVRWSRDDQPL